MAGAFVRIEVDDSQFKARLEQLARRIDDLTEPFRDIGAYLERSHDARFVKMVSPGGKTWAKLSQVTLAKKRKNKDKILQESGNLRDSLHSEGAQEAERQRSGVRRPPRRRRPGCFVGNRAQARVETKHEGTETASV